MEKILSGDFNSNLPEFENELSSLVKDVERIRGGSTRKITFYIHIHPFT